jgi:hypothetical protein
MTTCIGSHLGSFGKGRQDLGKALDYLAGQRLVVDVAHKRACSKDFVEPSTFLC